MKKVYKYELEATDEQKVILPKGAQILTVQEQNDLACLWALIDTEETEQKERILKIAGTGHPIKDFTELKYISTFQLCGGSLVFHVFEKMA